MASQELLVYVIAVLAYFVPYYIAVYRKAEGQHLVFWFNLLFGWTFFAWILLIIVALSLKGERHHHHRPTLSA